MKPKFRAWMKQYEKMDNDIGEMYFEDGEFKYIGDDVHYKQLPEDVILMLSTGIKDKNGKEIFEDDIITTNAYSCIVCFGEYTYFENEHTQTTGIGFYLSFLNVSPATYAPFEKFYWDNCEVIGNIHENELDLIVYEAWKFNEEREDA